jgi:hypothetical protein
MKSPATGTHDVVCSWSAQPPSGGQLYWISVTGGDTTTASRTLYTQTQSVTGPGLTVVDSQNGDLVIHAIAMYDTSITFDGGETTQENDNINTVSLSAGLSYKAATGANTVVGATDTSLYVELAVALIPGGAAAAETFGFRRRLQQ